MRRLRKRAGARFGDYLFTYSAENKDQEDDPFDAKVSAVEK